MMQLLHNLLRIVARHQEAQVVAGGAIADHADVKRLEDAKDLFADAAGFRQLIANQGDQRQIFFHFHAAQRRELGQQRLGQQVAARIPSGSTLFLDAGSTLLAVAAQLKGPLTVITASLDIAQLFSDRTDIQLILLGGQWDSKQRLFAGSATLSLVTRYRADIAILGACALHAGLGLSASQEADADVKRAMLAASAEHWLVADHTKLNRCEPWRVAGLSDIHHLFLDRPWAELGDDPALSVHIADA